MIHIQAFKKPNSPLSKKSSQKWDKYSEYDFLINDKFFSIAAKFCDNNICKKNSLSLEIILHSFPRHKTICSKLKKNNEKVC